MRRWVAVAWLIPGFVVSVIDAWLSIQSIVGIINSGDLFSYVVGIVMGLALTGFAVLAPVIDRGSRGPIFKAMWFLLLVVDLSTSALGAIWYGQMKNSFTEPIDFTMLAFDFSEWQPTAIFLSFTAVVAWCCVQLGRAINTLMD